MRSFLEMSTSNCQDFLDCWDRLSASVKIECLNRDKSRPQGLVHGHQPEKLTSVRWCLKIDVNLFLWTCSNDEVLNLRFGIEEITPETELDEKRGISIQQQILVTLRKSRKSSEKKQLRGIVFTIQWIFFFWLCFSPFF